MKFSDEVYDKLKWCAMLFLPALAVAVKRIFNIWDFPYGDQIGDTIVALNALLSACLGISTIQYHKTGIEEDGDPE